MSRTIILLVSADVVKQMTGISDNIAQGYLLPSIQEAQEIRLKSILGTNLLRTLTQMVEDGEIDNPGNEMYQELISQCQYYLSYQSVVELIGKVSMKVGNFGVMRSTDDRASQASFNEEIIKKSDYQAKADFYCYELQGWLLENRTSFPELTDNQCTKIQSNLYSAATCGIYLGGVRGARL